jgi:hypothetical protein
MVGGFGSRQSVYASPIAASAYDPVKVMCRGGVNLIQEEHGRLVNYYNQLCEKHGIISLARYHRQGTNHDYRC